MRAARPREHYSSFASPEPVGSDRGGLHCADPAARIASQPWAFLRPPGQPPARGYLHAPGAEISRSPRCAGASAFAVRADSSRPSRSCPCRGVAPRRQPGRHRPRRFPPPSPARARVRNRRAFLPCPARCSASGLAPEIATATGLRDPARAHSCQSLPSSGTRFPSGRVARPRWSPTRVATTGASCARPTG